MRGFGGVAPPCEGGIEDIADLPAAMLGGGVVRIALLKQAEADAHHGAALDLAIHEQRFDRPPDVVD